MVIKGNLVVGQSGGPTAVINNSLVGVIHEAKEHPEIGGIYGMLHGIRGVLDQEFVDLRQESDDTIETLRQTPASALGTVRYKVQPDDYDRLVEVFRANNIRFFVYVGGNDSMDTTYKIHQAAEKKGYELYAIGVPKTVDNDLAMTDHCPGYGSAARFVASAIRNTGFDTEAMGESGPIKIMEIMGRDAGWLTASAALAKECPEDPPHLVYLPERPVSPTQIVEDTKEVYAKYGVCVLAVSEGLRSIDGKPFADDSTPTEVDAFGHTSKGGVVEAIAALIKKHLGLRARLDKPNYLQRSFAELQSWPDRDEAYQVGRAAVQAAVAGQSGQMVTLVRQSNNPYRITTGLAPLEQVANAVRLVPQDFINERGNGVTEAFVEYARPLIGGNLTAYARLAKRMVPKVN